MPKENVLSAELSEADFAAMKDAIQVFKDKLPFLTNLTPQERQAYPKMGDKSLGFVKTALGYAKDFDDLVPPYLDVEEFEKDMKLVKMLSALAREINMLAEGLDDTIMLAGSEAYRAALVYYRSIDIARKLNLPGTDTIYEDLRDRYPRRRKPKPKASTNEALDKT